jgi:hypothetical protein
VLPVYALCVRKNHDGGCVGFEARAQETRR